MVINKYHWKLVREEGFKYSGQTVIKPQTIYKMFKDIIGNEPREHVIAIYLNNKLMVNGFSIISVGTNNAALIHPRDLYQHALLANANAVAIAHNHPSGLTTPSDEDLEITKRLAEAGDVLDIKLVDHVIIGDGECYSIAEDKCFAILEQAS